MFLGSCVFVALVGVQSPKLTAKGLVSEASLVAAKVVDVHEAAIARFTIGEAYNHIGSKKEALQTLRSAWAQFLQYNHVGIPENIDIFTLFVDGDIATMPVNFGVEFLKAGSLGDAKKAADSYGDTPLGKSFRHELGMRIRTQFPDAFEVLAFTDDERLAREKNRNQAIVELDAIKEEPDVMHRLWKYYQLGDRLMMLNAPKEAESALDQCMALVPEVKDQPQQALIYAQAAMGYWNVNQKDKAKATLNKGIEIDSKLAGESKAVMQSHYAVEQSKNAFGMPNRMKDVTARMDQIAGGLERPTAPPSPMTDSAYDLLATAEGSVIRGDKPSARKSIAKLKNKLNSKVDADGTMLGFVADLQLRMGDLAEGKRTILESNSRMLRALKPMTMFESESFSRLERAANLQASLGDRKAGQLTLATGIQKLAAGKETIVLPHMTPAKTKNVVHDRRSPILFRGALSLASMGDISGAVAMARTIKREAHRSVALAKIAQKL